MSSSEVSLTSSADSNRTWISPHISIKGAELQNNEMSNALAVYAE